MHAARRPWPTRYARHGAHLRGPQRTSWIRTSTSRSRTDTWATTSRSTCGNARFGRAEIFKVFSKVVMFTTIDDAWREHLREMDDLRQSVQNATYEQKDPLLIYKFESFGLFSKMIIKVNRDVLAILNKAYIPCATRTPRAYSASAGARQGRRQQVAGFAHAGCGSGRAAGQTETDARACREEGRPQRPVPLRKRQEIQAVPRKRNLTKFNHLQTSSSVR